jgi:Ni/Co efflux regulator RcnB
MSLKKLLTTGVVSTALVAANFTAFANSAQADSWQGQGKYRSDYSRSWNNEPRNWNNGGPKYRNDRHGYKKDNSDKKLARGIAIGLGVLLIGSILASEANHR